jgi:hypothetical protein
MRSPRSTGGVRINKHGVISLPTISSTRLQWRRSSCRTRRRAVDGVGLLGDFVGVIRSWRVARGVGPTGWLLGLCALACGCRPADEPLVPVAGRITLGGKPVSEGSISFRPDTAKENKSLHHPTGSIDAQGRYRLYIREREGAPAGWYKVIVFVNEPIADERGRVHPGMPKSLIDSRYNRPNDTPLAVEVKLGAAPGSYDFDVEPP